MKEKFFRFPEAIHQNAKGFFEKEIGSVIPQFLCFEKSTLAETIYGARGEGDDKIIVQRSELLQLAFKSIAPGKTKFDLDYLGDQVKAIRDKYIQKLLAEFHVKMPDEGAWKNFCAQFQLPRKDGTVGARVLNVLMNVGEPKEYKDLSKDGTGSYRKALKGHKGQIVYVETSMDKKGETKKTAQVRPVYAFESQTQVSKELAEKFGDKCRVIGFFQSGCLVEIDKPAFHVKQPLPPGKYRLNTIRTDSKDVKVTTADGKTHPEIPRYSLGNMIAAGFRRVEVSQPKPMPATARAMVDLAPVPATKVIPQSTIPDGSRPQVEL